MYVGLWSLLAEREQQPQRALSLSWRSSRRAARRRQLVSPSHSTLLLHVTQNAKLKFARSWHRPCDARKPAASLFGSSTEKLWLWFLINWFWSLLLTDRNILMWLMFHLIRRYLLLQYQIFFWVRASNFSKPFSSLLGWQSYSHPAIEWGRG